MPAINRDWLRDNVTGPPEANIEGAKLGRVTAAFSATWNKRGAFGEKLSARLIAFLQAPADANHSGEALTLIESQGVVRVYKEFMEARAQGQAVPTGAKAKILQAICDALPRELPNLGELPVVLGVLDNLVVGDQMRIAEG